MGLEQRSSCRGEGTPIENCFLIPVLFLFFIFLNFHLVQGYNIVRQLAQILFLKIGALQIVLNVLIYISVF